MARSYIEGPGRCQFLLCSTKIPLLNRPARPQSDRGHTRNVPYRAARSHSERAASSACVGKWYSAPQIVWNKSTRRARERGGARVGRPKWLRILTHGVAIASEKEPQQTTCAPHAGAGAVSASVAKRLTSRRSSLPVPRIGS